jgi:peptidyl-prolyl cis-trans isomerase B (cyclophilin B)
MIFAKASLIFAVVSFAAFFCAQSAEAARGPKITNKIYFDIQHGDQPMGRSAFILSSLPFKFRFDEF